jgi:tripeptidyl-peptidase-1
MRGHGAAWRARCHRCVHCLYRSPVLFSSGDFGVGDGEPSLNETECYASDGRRTFLPTFPATCTYVTSVGATRYIAPEIGVGFSGGGFSNYFSRPLYQALAAPGFLAQLPRGTYAGLYNSTGRGFPDMSAQGVRFAISVRNRTSLISGTSASTPATAGLFARLNDARLAAGLPSIGFANPLLYAGLGFGFNDITRGNNPGCGTPGWNATKVGASVCS